MSENEDISEFDFERIYILYANSNLGYAGMAAAVLFMAFVVEQFSSPTIAVIWMVAMIVAYLPRIALSIAFKIKVTRNQIDNNNVKPWERYFNLACIAPFLCFASAIFIPYGENSDIGLLLYAVVVMTLIAGGVITYSTSLPAILLFINLTMLPLIVRCLLMQDFLFTALGGAIAIGYLLIMRLILKQNSVLLENIALKIENKRQSLTDPLTKLWNRRRLHLLIENLIPVSRRSGEPFSIILVDIDHFKQYNDTHGHGSGDEVLVCVSAILEECSRDQDLVVRYGGDEFLLVLPATNIKEAVTLTERIRSAIKDRTQVTISAGLAMHSKDMEFDQLVQSADTSLYVAKESGRDSFASA